jgi:hypothetical protein
MIGFACPLTLDFLRFGKLLYWYETDYSCGGKACGQDGVTVRRLPPVRNRQAPKGAFFIAGIIDGADASFK